MILNNAVCKKMKLKVVNCGLIIVGTESKKLLKY